MGGPDLKAACALHFEHYNLVRVHLSLRVTHAMAAGITNETLGQMTHLQDFFVKWWTTYKIYEPILPLSLFNRYHGSLTSRQEPSHAR